MPPSDPAVFRTAEVSVMIALCAGLDPARYANPETQDVIRHCMYASALAGEERLMGKVVP